MNKQETEILQAFVYILARDHVVMGDLEDILQEINEYELDTILFESESILQFSEEVVDRLNEMSEYESDRAALETNELLQKEKELKWGPNRKESDFPRLNSPYITDEQRLTLEELKLKVLAENPTCGISVKVKNEEKEI